MAYLYISYHWVKKRIFLVRKQHGKKPLGNPRLPPYFPMVSTRETQRFHVVSSEGNILRSGFRDFLPWKPVGNQ